MAVCLCRGLVILIGRDWACPLRWEYLAGRALSWAEVGSWGGGLREGLSEALGGLSVGWGLWRGTEVGQEKGALARCLGGRGRTFRTGQRLLAQDAETEVLVEAAGSGLVQHLWAPIHSVQLEEAPSVQLRLGVAGGGLNRSSDLPSPNWVSEPWEGSVPRRKCSPRVWDP